MNYSRKHRTRSEMSHVFVEILVGVFFFFLCCPLALAAEPPVPPSAEWSKIYRGHPGATDENPIGAYSVILADGHYIVAGSQSVYIWDPYHPPAGIGHWAALAKLDLNGNIVDSKTFYEEDDHNGAYSVIPSYSGTTLDGYVVTGFRHAFFEEDGHEYYTPWAWLMKMDTGLEKLWEKTWEPTLDSPFSDWGNSVIQDDSGFVIGGQKSIDTLVTYAGYLIRADNSGNLDWAIDGYMHDGGVPRYPWIGHGREIHSIKRTIAGDYIMGTSTGIIKANAVTGGPPTHAWTAGEGSYYSVRQTGDGGYIGVGRKLVEVVGAEDRYDVILTKLNSSGAVSWNQTFGRLTPALGASGLDDHGRDVIQTSDGGYALLGSTQSYSWHGSTDMWLIKTDDEGIMEWDLVLGDQGADSGRALVEAPDGGLVLTGSMAWEGTSRMWIIKIRSGGFTPPVPSFACTPASPFFVEESIEFNASASADDNSIVSYEWDFGDGYTGSGEVDPHTYIRPISYTATLYVTDNDGVRRETSQELTAIPLELQWERFYGDAHDYGQDIVAAPDGGLVIAGGYGDSLRRDLWIFKTNSRGRVIWDKKYDNNLYSSLRAGARAVTLAHDGGYVTAGFRESYANPPHPLFQKVYDVWILKVDDAEGEMDWENYFVRNWNDDAQDIAPTRDNGYIITGYTTRELSPDPPQYRKDVWLIKTDIGGNHDWDSTISAYDLNDGVEGYAVCPTADNGFTVTGKFTPVPSSKDRRIMTVKTDSGGTKAWSGSGFASGTSGNSRTEGRWVCQTPDMGYMIAARHDSICALQKLRPDGTQEWLKKWGETTYPSPISATKTPDWGFAIVGHYYIDWEIDYNWDLFITRTDSEGEIAWEWDYPLVDEDETAQQILRLSDGSFVILAARAYSTQSTWLLKLGPNHPPTGDFTYMPDPPEAGRQVTFSASASDQDGSIVSYEWRFGDNGEEDTSAPTIAHIYQDAGDYTVTLTVVDNDGGEYVVSHDITVDPAGPIPGDLDADDDVDGMDLAGLSGDIGQLDLVIFAEAFGRIQFP